MNRDPIEEAGGINLYAICGNDLLDNFDVLGNQNFADQGMDNSTTTDSAVWDSDPTEKNDDSTKKKEAKTPDQRAADDKGATKPPPVSDQLPVVVVGGGVKQDAQIEEGERQARWTQNLAHQATERAVDDVRNSRPQTTQSSNSALEWIGIANAPYAATRGAYNPVAGPYSSPIMTGSQGTDAVGTLVGTVLVLSSGIATDALGVGAPTLSSQALRGIRSLQKQIAIHEAKLAEFVKNPTVRPGMEGQPRTVIEAAQQARIRHLQREIEAFRGSIEKLKKSGQ